MNNNDRIKIVVSTFNNSANNYGAVFQACALSWKLTSMGYDTTYLSLLNRANSIAQPKRDVVWSLKCAVASFLSLSTKRKRSNRAAKFLAFVKSTQNLVEYYTYDELMQSPPVADIYLSGSDQVWNATNMHDELLLSFAPEGKRRISYAASMGKEIIPEINRAKFVEYIGKFDAISVREDTMIDLIKPLTKHTVYQHIDPVFLKSQEEWVKLEKPYYVLFDKYILLYIIDWDKRNDKRIQRLKRETGLPTVEIVLGGRGHSYADQSVFDASPEEFLYLLHHAEMVVASSFHGTALSIIYHKPFLTVSGHDKPSRIESLLRHFHLCSHNSPELSWERAQFDYHEIDRQILCDQIKAECYLRSAIEA